MTKIAEQESPAEIKEIVGKNKVSAKAKKAEKIESSTLKVVSNFSMHTVIAPIVSEKSARLSSNNVMIFRVALDANRVSVAQAIKELYGIRPVKVNIINVRSRAMTFGRNKGMTKKYKKAMVKLPVGTTIDVFTSV